MRPPGNGGPRIPYPFKYFEKYPISLKKIWQISPKFRKHCVPISLKNFQVCHIPLNIYKNIPYPFKFLANIPVSLKTLPGPHSCFNYPTCTERGIYPKARIPVRALAKAPTHYLDHMGRFMKTPTKWHEYPMTIRSAGPAAF